MGGGSGSAEVKRARLAEAAREQRVRTGTAQIRQQFAGTFNEPYFKNLQDTATAKYTNDAQKQYQEALKDMRYALMRSGMNNSTVAGKAEADAAGPGGAWERATTAIADQARGLANQRRGDVVNAESLAVNQLNASGDQNAAAIQAANLIAANKPDPVAPPLGQLFTDLSAGLATQADLERNNQNRYTVFGNIPGWSARNRYSTTVR